MTQVTVRIPMPLRTFTGGAAEVVGSGATVREVLAALGQDHSGLLPRILTPDGQIRSFVNIYLGEDNVRVLQGLDTTVPEGVVLSIIPAVAGGAKKEVKGPARERRLLDLRARIPELSPGDAHAMQQQGAALVDVREQDEIAQGSPAGAHRLGRGFLELRVEEAMPDLDRPVLVMCGGGTRSLFAAEDLLRLGYRDVRSVAGGFTRWKNEGLPFEVPLLLDERSRERYSRHLLMPEVGEAGQLRLMTSKVMLVGAGGLGSPAALYLAAAGVGTLGIVDHDVVDRSNLQRQILHTDARVGTSKVDSARTTLLALNPALHIDGHALRLDSRNVEELLRVTRSSWTARTTSRPVISSTTPASSSGSRTSMAPCSASRARYRCSGPATRKPPDRVIAASIPSRRHRSWRRPAPRPGYWAFCQGSSGFCRRSRR